MGNVTISRSGPAAGDLQGLGLLRAQRPGPGWGRKRGTASWRSLPNWAGTPVPVPAPSRSPAATQWALCCCATRNKWVRSRFYLNVLAGIEAVLGEREQNLMLRIVAPDAGPRPPLPAAAWVPQTDPGEAAVPAERKDLAVYRRWVGERRVDGVLVFDQTRDDPRGALLESLGLPFVLVGATAAPAARSAATAVDQGADAAEVIAALHALGHTCIAYVSGPEELAHEQARRPVMEEQARSVGMAGCSWRPPTTRPTTARRQPLPWWPVWIRARKRSPRRLSTAMTSWRWAVWRH